MRENKRNRIDYFDYRITDKSKEEIYSAGPRGRKLGPMDGNYKQRDF